MSSRIDPSLSYLNIDPSPLTFPFTSTPPRSFLSFLFDTTMPSLTPHQTQAHPQHNPTNTTLTFNFSMVPPTLSNFFPLVSCTQNREQPFTFPAPPPYNERNRIRSTGFCLPSLSTIGIPTGKSTPYKHK